MVRSKAVKLGLKNAFSYFMYPKLFVNVVFATDEKP
jgi:hypothetical protein